MNKQLIISSGEFLDRLCYYGFLSIYILLAMHFTKSTHEAIKQYSLYCTFGFSLPIVLGYFSDKWDLHYPITVLGFLLFTASFFILINHHDNVMFIISSALILLAIGCFKSNNLKVFVDHNDHAGKFNIYYAFMTAGSIAGPLLFGYYYNIKNISTPAAITICLAAFMCVIYMFYFWKKIIGELKNRKNLVFMIGIMLSLITFILGSYYSSNIYDAYIITLISIVIIIFKGINDKVLVKKLIALLTFSSIFFITEILSSGILLLYIKNNLGSHFYAITIPIPYFTVIFSLIAIFLALSFSRYLISLESKVFNLHYYKLLIGGILGIISMLLLQLSNQDNANLGLLIVLLSLFFLGIADFLIAPSIYNYLSLLSTEKIKSTLYSLFFMSISLSAYLSVKLFTLTTIVFPQNDHSQKHYLMTFLLSGILLLFALPLLAPLKLKKQAVLK